MSNTNGIIAGIGDFGISQIKDEAVDAKDLAQQYAEDANQALESLAGVDFEGEYNITTNTPALTATPSPSLNNGKYYIVNGSGTIGFAGTNFSVGQVFNTGDRLVKKGSQWVGFILAQNTAKIAEWIAQSYSIGSQVIHGGLQWESVDTTLSTDEPGVSPKWIIINSAFLVNKKNVPFKVILNNNLVESFTSKTETNYINGLRIVVQGSNKNCDAIKTGLDLIGCTYLIVRVYENNKVIDSQKITTGIRTGRIDYVFEFLHTIYMSSANEYTFEITSDGYTGFQASTLESNDFKRAYYKSIDSPTWISAFGGTKGIAFELYSSVQILESDTNDIGIVGYSSKNSIYGGGAGFSAWAFSIDFSLKTKIRKLILNLDNVNYNDYLRLNLYKRVPSDNSAPNRSISQTLLFSGLYPKSLFTDTSSAQDCIFDVGTILMESGDRLLVELIPLKSNNFGKVGFSTYGDDQNNRASLFYYRLGDTKLNYSSVDNLGNFPSYIVLGYNSEKGNILTSRTSIAHLENGIVTEYDAGQTQTVAETKTVTVATQVDNSAINWTKLRNNVGTNGEAIINIVSISIPSKTEGTHYEVNRGMGMIRALGSSFTADITTVMAYERRIALVKNETTGAKSVIYGAAGRTAGLEYNIPTDNAYTIIAEYISRYRTLTKVDSFKDRNYNFPSLVTNRNLAQKMKFRKKISNGEPVYWAGHGDSNTARQAGIPDFNPNGTLRDRIEFFWVIFTDDYLGTIPITDGHIQSGWNWYAVKALQQISQGAINYLNFGIAGTDSSNTSPNGSYSERLNAIKSSQADVIVIGFGMNEIGSNYTYQNLKYIAEQLQEVGKECIFLDCPKPSGYNSWWTLETWEKTNAQIKLVAEHTQSVHVSFSEFLKNGWNRFDDYGRCRQNNWNHPSPQEFKNYGEMINAVLF